MDQTSTFGRYTIFLVAASLAVALLAAHEAMAVARTGGVSLIQLAD